MICAARYAGHFLKDNLRQSTWRLLWSCFVWSSQSTWIRDNYNSAKSLIKYAPLNLSDNARLICVDSCSFCFSVSFTVRGISTSPDPFSVILYISTRGLQTFLFFSSSCRSHHPATTSLTLTISPPAPHFLTGRAAHITSPFLQPVVTLLTFLCFWATHTCLLTCLPAPTCQPTHICICLFNWSLNPWAATICLTLHHAASHQPELIVPINTEQLLLIHLTD